MRRGNHWKIVSLSIWKACPSLWETEERRLEIFELLRHKKYQQLEET
jgi:hypothetical protein